MTETGKRSNQAWTMAKADLCRAVLSLGFPAAFGDLLARELGSPRSMSRMTAYLRSVQPHSVEMIVDEMLAICADTETWRGKAESREAQQRYSAWLNSEERRQGQEEE